MRHLLVLLAGTALLLGACDARKTDSDVPGAEAASGPFLDLLRLVPDVPEYRALVEMGDVERTLEALGIERPAGEYDEVAVAAFVEEVWETRGGGFPPVQLGFFSVVGDLLLTFSSVTQRSVGLSLLDVEQWLEAGPPPEQVLAIRGAFDPDAFATNLEACDQCAPGDVAEYRGWPIYAWGEDSEFDISRRFEPPLFDHLGRGGRFALSEHLVARTLSTDAAHAVVDAYEGDGSLADVEDFRLAIATLEKIDVLALIASDRALSPEAVEEFLAEAPDGAAAPWEVQPGDTVLVPYEVIAAGDGWDGGHYSAVVLVHASEDHAEENARRFADRIASTRLPANFADLIDDVEVTVDGRVLRARIEGDGINRGHFFFSSLLLHE